MTKTSLHKKKTTNPAFNEILTVCAGGLCGNSSVALTMLDHNSGFGFGGTHKFVGQAVINMKEALPNSYFTVENKASVLFENVPLGKQSLPVPDYHGKGTTKLGNVEGEGCGKLTVEFLPLQPSTSHCGWLEIARDRTGTKPRQLQWERKWGLLIGGALSIHNSPFRLHETLWSVESEDALSCEVAQVEGVGEVALAWKITRGSKTTATEKKVKLRAGKQFTWKLVRALSRSTISASP